MKKWIGLMSVLFSVAGQASVEDEFVEVLSCVGVSASNPGVFEDLKNQPLIWSATLRLRKNASLRAAVEEYLSQNRGLLLTGDEMTQGSLTAYFQGKSFENYKITPVNFRYLENAKIPGYFYTRSDEGVAFWNKLVSECIVSTDEIQNNQLSVSIQDIMDGFVAIPLESSTKAPEEVPPSPSTVGSGCSIS